MDYELIYTAQAAKDFRRLDRPVQQRIKKFFDDLGNPRSKGTAMQGPEGFWRYRIGGYRVIVVIEDDAVRVLVVRLGSRGQVYRD